MKKLLGLIFMLAGIMAFAETATTLEVPTVAVLAFESRDRSAGNVEAGKSVAELLSIALMETGCADLVERAELDKALGELQLSSAGLTSKENQNKLGKLIGAKILITGSVFKSGDKNYVVAKVIGTETSRVLGASVSGNDDFITMVPELATKLAEILEKRATQLMPKIEKPDAVAIELATKIKGNSRKVFVSINENTSAANSNRVAEMEVKKILTTLGFVLVTSQDEADFVLKGQAFASNAGMYKNFTSAAARVELSIFGKNNKLLVTGADKETVASGTYLFASQEAISQATLRLSKELFVVMK